MEQQVKNEIQYDADAVEVDHVMLRERLGAHLYRQRINTQSYHAAQVFGQGLTAFHPENMRWLRVLIEWGMRGTCLYGWGNRNARKHRVIEHPVQLRRLPEAFQGFRMLHLSDLHLDLDEAINASWLSRVGELEFDICVITGDFRAETAGDRMPAMRALASVVPRLGDRIYACLGNHDDIEMTSYLEAFGVRVLLNEHAVIEQNGEAIFLAGIDDPHFYETENLERAVSGIPAEATKVLLSHSAEPYRKALACGVDLMLSGHTHGGQLCLPGGIAVMRNVRHPRSMSKGAWAYHELRGYTSTGAGCSMVPVRMFCTPELTVHVLERGEAEL